MTCRLQNKAAVQLAELVLPLTYQRAMMSDVIDGGRVNAISYYLL